MKSIQSRLEYLGKMIDMEARVVRHVVAYMLEIEVDKLIISMNEHMMDSLMMLLMGRVEQLMLELFAIVLHDRKDWAASIVPVVLHRKHLRRVQIEDRESNGKYGRCRIELATKSRLILIRQR
jgi:hypothetical protein